MKDLMQDDIRIKDDILRRIARQFALAEIARARVTQHLWAPTVRGKNITITRHIQTQTQTHIKHNANTNASNQHSWCQVSLQKY